MSSPCSGSIGFTEGQDQMVVGERRELRETRMAAESRNIQEQVNKEPYLLGIVLMFCCVDAKGIEHKLDGLEAAVDKVWDVCGKLGFLPVRLNENVSSCRIRDMIEIMTKIKYPPSYHFVTVYFTGHGKKGSICTADGEMSIRDIVMPFHQDTCPDTRNRIKFFVFDCCRTVDSSCRESAMDYMIIENCYFLFAITPNHFAYYTETSTGTDQKKRCGRLTDIFVRLMHTENKPFVKLALMARLEIKELSKNEEINQDVGYYENTAIKRTVCLLKESVGTCRIAPTDLKVIPESPYSLCYQVTGNFKGHCKRIKRIEIEVEREDSSSISVVASVPLSSDGTFKATTEPLQKSSIYQLRAVAVYNDALGGGPGEFRTPNEKLMITVKNQENVMILNTILNDMPTFKLKMANVVFVGPPRGGKSSLLCSIVGLAPPEASTAVVEYTHATMYEGCIRTILATLEGDCRLKTLTPQETKKRADLSILLNYIHAAQMQKNKQGITEKNDEIHHNVNGSHDAYEQGDASNPENSVDTHETLGHEGTDIEETREVTEQHHPQGKHSENKDIEQPTYDIDVFDLKQSLATLIEEGVMNRIFANQEKLLVHLFDTGGQPELLELLPHILSAPNSILVICFKESEPLNERYLVKYSPEDKSKHCLTTLSQLTTEETIFQCTYGAKHLLNSTFSRDNDTIFVATHIDQVNDMSRNHKKKIQDYMVGLGLLPRDTASDLMSQRFFRVCTERELQILLACLYSEDKNEVLINDLFTKEHEEWIGKMDKRWTEIVIQEESIKYVGDNDGRKVELQPLLDILKHHRQEKVKDLLEYTGVSEVTNVLCKMIHKTEESVDISLRAYLLYLALVHKEHKENDANIEPIVTLFECIQIAEALHCIPPHITSFKEKMKEVLEYLEMLESKLHLVKCSFSSEDEVDPSALIICDPNALYKKISEMVCQCYLDPRNKNKLRRRGLVDEDMLLKCTFQRTVEGIRMAQKYCKDGSQHDGAEEILLKYLHNQRIISYKNDGLIRVPSALRAYPTEIIPMSKNVIVPSLLFVPKGKCLPLGVITTLMTCGEEWKYGNDNIMVIWTLFPEELFRNRVKYHVNGSMYVTLVARPTCIEIRVEEQKANEYKCDDTSIFRKACESLKNKLEEIVHVEFKCSLFCRDHMTASTEYLGNDGFRCKHFDPHSGYIKNCSVWYEEVSSTEELTNILYSPVCSNPSGINNDARPDGENVKSYFAEGDDTKSDNEETKAHFRKMKWFKIGLLLLKGQTYDALEDYFEKLFLEDPDTDFSSEVIKMWLKTEDASWDSLYRNIEFAYPDIAKKIEDDHGRCQNEFEVECDPKKLQKSSFEEKADEYALRECQSVIVSTIAKDLTHFSNLLAQLTFIRSDLGMEIQKIYGITESEKASELFSHVTNRFHIMTLPAEREKLFERFLSMFTVEAAYYDVAKQMMEKYVERDPAYNGPMRTLIEDVREDESTAFHLPRTYDEVETGCENTPTPTPHVRIPEKDISHVYLGGYLQPVVVLIIGVLLGLVWWVYNSYLY